MIELNKIYCEDNIKTIGRFPDDFIDLTITLPPYNVNLGNNKFKKDHYLLYKDNKEHSEYLEWLKDIFSNLFLKTKSGGRCVINIGDGKNGEISTYSDIINMMKCIGWINYTVICWI
jgi:DNA modification methylase